MARACGWSAAEIVTDMPSVEALRPRLRREALFATIRISPEDATRFLPPRDGAYLTTRFRAALGVAPS
jgi:hypothetical protein